MAFLSSQKVANRIGVGTIHLYLLLFVLQISFNLPQTVSGQEDAVPKQVLLQWKFKEGQTYRGKHTFGIKTDDENPQQTTFNYDFQWKVVKKQEDENHAIVNVKVDRIRMRHRSKAVGAGFVDYDSRKDHEFQTSESVMKELKKFLSIIRAVQGKEHPLTFSAQGSVSAVKGQPVAALNMSPAAFPTLPNKELKPGDKWKAKQRIFVLTKIEKIEDHTVAIIESTKDTSRFRFLVEEGRFLDGATWNVTRYEPQKTSSSFRVFLLVFVTN